jgi:hypothetical protein
MIPDSPVSLDSVPGVLQVLRCAHPSHILDFHDRRASHSLGLSHSSTAAVIDLAMAPAAANCSGAHN